MKESLLRKCLLIGIIAGVMGLVTLITNPSLIHAQEPFKIGVLQSLTGPLATHGTPAKQTWEWLVPKINAKGGILGRKVEVIYEDDQSVPAVAARKARKLVEEDGVKFIQGATGSSCALAVSALLPRWKVIMFTSINGDASLTGSKYVPYFFRFAHSAPMETKGVVTFVADNQKLKTFAGIGSDYSWGRSSVGQFEQLISKTQGKKWVGSSLFVPQGTADFAPYIAKLRELKPDAVYHALAAQDAVAFGLQAKTYGLTQETQVLTAVLQLADIKGSGDAMEGFIGHSRYTFRIDNPKNKAFVKEFYEDNKYWPSEYNGTTTDAINFFIQAVTKAGTDDVEAIIKAMEDMEYDGVIGRFKMRGCDHQAVFPGLIVKAVKAPGYPHLIPDLMATYPGEKMVPQCRKDAHE